MTDQQLQRELAKMLPGLLLVAKMSPICPAGVVWRSDISDIKPTELEHIVRLIELSLDQPTYDEYQARLKNNVAERKVIGNDTVYKRFNERAYLSASWQGRARAIIETVKAKAA